MTMVARPLPRVKPSRPSRPFGAGILPAAPRPGRPDVTARFLAAKSRVEARRDAAYRTCSGGGAAREIADVALDRIARLRAAAGRVGADRKAITSTSDAIPAGVTRVRVVEGPSAGVWARPAVREADCRWTMPGDAGRWVAARVMSDWLVAGKVAILADAPAAQPRPADEDDVEADPDTWPAWTDSDRWELSDLPIEGSPAPVASIAEKPAPSPRTSAAKVISRRVPTASDRTFESARTIGLEAEGYVAPPSHLPSDLVAAWQLGMAEAGSIISARDADHYRDLAWKAECDEKVAAGCY